MSTLTKVRHSYLFSAAKKEISYVAYAMHCRALQCKKDAFIRESDYTFAMLMCTFKKTFF
jgi:hypothetical protein